MNDNLLNEHDLSDKSVTEIIQEYSENYDIPESLVLQIIAELFTNQYEMYSNYTKHKQECSKDLNITVSLETLDINEVRMSENIEEGLEDMLISCQKLMSDNYDFNDTGIAFLKKSSKEKFAKKYNDIQDIISNARLKSLYAKKYLESYNEQHAKSLNANRLKLIKFARILKLTDTILNYVLNRKYLEHFTDEQLKEFLTPEEKVIDFMNKEYFNSSRNIITIYQALKADEIVISQKVATFEMIVNFLDTSTSLLNANKRIFDLLNFKDISKTKNLELTASLKRIAKVIEEEEKRLSKIIK